jgi:putative restriction endonuclease
MRAYIGVTDRDWYRFLKAQPMLEEVNFWQPSAGGGFRALSLGQPFLFKLHYPDNAIVGGGFLATYSPLPVSMAWETFGVENGAPTLEEMRRRIEHYRKAAPDLREDYTIGCIILEDPFFFEERDWIPAPADFKPNIVRGKRYDLTVSPGRELWERVMMLRSAGPRRVGESPGGPMFGDPRPVRRRLGQGAFRVMVTDTYERRCAVTREKALPVLEAAHIRPVTKGGIHELPNGLLLRSDVHRLYDKGYVTVTPDRVFRVSRRLKTDFHNGEHYLQLDGSPIWTPRSEEAQPARAALEWHADAVFKR